MFIELFKVVNMKSNLFSWFVFLMLVITMALMVSNKPVKTKCELEFEKCRNICLNTHVDGCLTKCYQKLNYCTRD